MPLIEELVNGDKQGNIKITFPRPTEINVRFNFDNPMNRKEIVSDLEGHVFGGWPEKGTFLVEINGEIWDVRLDYEPNVVSFHEDA